ncbi:MULTISPECIES: hypothetical protein [unclassified Mesorhizobium]|uniref:hypothetical protein n=1 Tax=unclassified Mesorhizobium TaxID=325217 RepID=UPI000BAEC01B|nr:MULTISPECIES: hypothetical protein [unclassified Mesorhizobium]TGT63847.1 hypothetical protein EN813_010815 [Mesorhizobium sp. M00.F.Ca.ET.170.01.1.1]AZO11077.1 hypothetical protein EJ074_19835 [Mesorhizobium sp. M3A.F.Ca.ET.080.04.2.1]PBB88639.1 hypothetical protein CK216_02640 [Mesorhizobium sp. WSM3876]RWE26052.1 MAG: hypothetical protein EOS41_08700 [Mesorhizobium sp.]RWE33829.1 MAG: hypothetical protein EOS77_11100 [Mesorhizobium sp.]
MRTSASLKTATIAAFLVAAPLAGAYAAGHHKGALDATEPTDLTGPRVTSLIDQIQGVDQGIKEAREANTISAAEAQSLRMRANHISLAAEKVAASDHGRIPAAQYHDLLRRLDNVDQKLMLDTGSSFLMGDGADGGHYPNG